MRVKQHNNPSNHIIIEKYPSLVREEGGASCFYISIFQKYKIIFYQAHGKDLEKLCEKMSSLWSQKLLFSGSFFVSLG